MLKYSAEKHEASKKTASQNIQQVVDYHEQMPSWQIIAHYQPIIFINYTQTYISHHMLKYSAEKHESSKKKLHHRTFQQVVDYHEKANKLLHTVSLLYLLSTLKLTYHITW